MVRKALLADGDNDFPVGSATMRSLVFLEIGVLSFRRSFEWESRVSHFLSPVTVTVEYHEDLYSYPSIPMFGCEFIVLVTLEYGLCVCALVEMMFSRMYCNEAVLHLNILLRNASRHPSEGSLCDINNPHTVGSFSWKHICRPGKR